MDLKKPFDTVSHNLLITNLEINRIRCIVLKCYLTKLTQSVCINVVKSDLLEVVCGVPQGSIVGAKLFLIYIYINDLCNVSSILKFALFMDDTNIFYSADNLELLSTIGLQSVNSSY